MGFDDAVKHVQEKFAEKFSVMMVKAIDEVFKQKLGVDYARYTIICGCGAKFAKAALDVSKDVGLLFPCSFVVYEDKGKIWVSHISIMKIAPAIGLATADAMAPVIKMTGEAVRDIWEKI